MENEIGLTDPTRQLIKKTAHDVRTPLTSIAGFADLIAEDSAVPENAREFAGIIIDEIQRLSKTLDRFFAEILANDEDSE